MDQELLDASRYRISSLSLDTRFADTYFPPSVIYPQDNCSPDTGTADIMWRMPSTYRNIMRIGLSSIELPEVEYVFSAKNGNISFSVSVNGAAPTIVTIEQGNYRSTEMVTELQAVFQAVDPLFNVGLNLVSGKITITHQNKPFQIWWASDQPAIAAMRRDWGIGYNLGFREKIVSSVADPTVALPLQQSMTGTSILRVQPAAYYLLQLLIPEPVENIKHRLTDGTSIPVFAKLVLRENWYHIQFDDNSNLLRKEYTFLTPVNVASVRMRLLDPYGRLVRIFDMDWSATLELYEVTNARAYHAVQQSYGRR
jgi:hypothetical protein